MGKSSSQVVGYRYYAKFAAFIGNRIEKLIAINFDSRGWQFGKTVRASQGTDYMYIKKPGLYGENEGGVSGIVTIKTGEPNQTVACELAGRNGDLASAYPYQSYLTFSADLESLFSGVNPELMLEEDLLDLTNLYDGSAGAQIGFYLGNSGYMKEMLLWVKRIHVKNDGDVQWYDAKSEIDANTQYTTDADIFANGLDFINIGVYDATVVFMDGRTVTRNDRLIKNSIRYNFGDNPKSGDMGRAFVSGSYNKAAFVRFTVGSYHKNVAVSFGGGVRVLGSKSLYSPNDYFSREYALIISGEYSISIIVKATTDGFQQLNLYADFYAGGNLDDWKLESGDINPIHKIREILTDDTAMAKPEADVNDINFTKAADRIYNEGLGVSWAIDEKSCIDAIEELCYHVEAGIRVNRQTGLYEMVLFRDDWFAEDEIHTIAENKIKDLSLEVMNSDDIVNQLNVTYYDRQRIKNSTFSIYENGSILTMGKANAESIDFPYFMNMRNAEVMANWKLKQYSTPAWKGTLTTGWREARKWNRYDLVKINWSKKWQGTILARIMKIDLGNGLNNEVMIDFEEVVPYSGEMNTSIVVDTPVDAGPQPPQPSINAVFEAPYYLAVLRAGQTNADLELSNNPDIGYVAAIAAKPQNNSLSALLFTDGGVGEFEQVSRLDYCDILQLDQSINETASAFVVTGSLTQTANSNNLILLNDELMGFVSFDTETKVLTVKRGALDTIPKKHNSGNLFVFDLPDVAFDSAQYTQSEVVEAQVLTTTPSGIQELSTTGTVVEVQSRAIRPYPPANVKINGEHFPVEIETDLVITWVDRNRVQQTGGEIIGWYESGVTIEPNTQTHLIISQLDEDQLELATSNANVTGATSYTMPISSMQANTRFVKVTLKTVRDGYECLQPFAHIVELSQFFSAPYNLNVEYSE